MNDDGDSAEAPHEARPEAHPDAVAPAGDQAAADVDARAGRPAEPGDGREPAARGGARPRICSRPRRPRGREAGGEPPPTSEKGDTWDDSDYEYFFGDYLDDGYRPRPPQEIKELPPIENTLSSPTSLSDHLLWQLSLQVADETTREIGSAIIGNLDDDGYLVASVDEIAAMGNWPLAEVERALRLVQGFDPIGVAARDLQECLWLQLRHLGLEGTPTEKIVTEHLRLLQNHQIPELAKKLGLGIDDLKQHIEVIRHLDPKPGSRYNRPQSHYVIPDVYVVKVDDQYVAVLNEDGLPQIRDQPGLPPAARQGHRADRRDAGLREGQVPFGVVADQVGGAAAEDDPQGGDQHHQLPAGLPGPRHRAPAAAGAARRRQRHRDARIDGQPRGQQQVHAHAPGRVRDEVTSSTAASAARTARASRR